MVSLYKDYTRLGGWLMFYVVTKMFSSVLNVTTMISVFAQRRVVDGILIVFPVALAITVVVQIFRRDDTARYWLLGEGICCVLSNAYQLFFVTPANVTGVVIVVCTAISYAAWFLYFVKSKRVAVYMHPEQYQRLQPPYGQPPYGQPPYGQPPVYGAPMPPMPPVSQIPPVQPAPAAPPAPMPSDAPPMEERVDALAQEPQAQDAARVCSRCGKQLSPEARFCGSCGNRVS